MTQAQNTTTELSAKQISALKTLAEHWSMGIYELRPSKKHNGLDAKTCESLEGRRLVQYMDDGYFAITPKGLDHIKSN